MTWEEREKGAITTKITVSGSRSPESIANDIKRKLLPDAIELWKRMKQKHRDNMARERATEEALQRLIKASGGNLTKSSDSTTLHLSDKERLTSGTVRMEGGGKTAMIELRYIPLEKAEAIVKLLA